MGRNEAAQKSVQARSGVQRGASLLEFTLVGIPIIFILISVFEISRGMWMYQTAAHASRETSRFIVVHGLNCKDASDACGRTISEIAQQLRFHLAGLDPNQVQVTFRAGCDASGTFRSSCGVATSKSPLQTFLSDTSTTHWPGQFGTPTLAFVEVEIEFPFRSAIAMFWPGAGGAQQFGVVNMFAASREMFQY